MNTIYCVGRNYSAHARELGNSVPSEPVVFLKAWNSLRGLSPVPMAHADEVFDHELEIVFQIGRRLAIGAEVSAEDFSGIALGLDLTRRQTQESLKERRLPWTLAKSFLGSAVVSPFLGIHEFGDFANIAFYLDVNGRRRQEGNSKDMNFSIFNIARFLLRFHELEPGDLIFTGTPAGVGPLTKGDRFVMGIESPKFEWSGTL